VRLLYFFAGAARGAFGGVAIAFLLELPNRESH
jgi:hypothetical protein